MLKRMQVGLLSEDWWLGFLATARASQTSKLKNLSSIRFGVASALALITGLMLAAVAILN